MRVFSQATYTHIVFFYLAEGAWLSILRPMIRVATCLALLCVFSLTASADTGSDETEVRVRIASQEQATTRKHSLYLEIFGKGGLYGVGYDYRWKRLVGVGVVASAYQIGSERTLSLSPYLSLYPLRRGHHSWFAQAGPRLVTSKVNSPVPGWEGDRSTSMGAQLSSGYEYENRILMRAFVMAVAGQGGVSPWAGVSVGVSF